MVVLVFIDVPACSNEFWELYPGILIPSGTSIGPASSEFACIDLCETGSTCVSVNWDRTGNVCEAFYEPVPDIASSTSSATGNHYRRCDVETGQF